jgi:transcriptional regulator with XRE-family HTH domain
MKLSTAVIPPRSRRPVEAELLKAIGSRLRQVRAAMGHSQIGFATLLEVSPFQLNRWEHGTIAPKLDAMVQLRRRTGVSTDFVYTGKPQTAVDRSIAAHANGMLEHQVAQRAAISQASSLLSEFESFVLFARNGLDGPTKTLAEIGRERGCSKQFVWEVEQRALRKLREGKDAR